MSEISAKKEVRVRFAPSPTGFLHVGGARTAIFNWLFARNQGGSFLIRIEDTDAQRSKSELSEQILRSMEWLGMDSDEPIVLQALNIERHREVAGQLLKTGKAYYAFETAEELDVQRKESQAKKQQFKYNRASLKLSNDTIEQYLKEGRTYAVRFLVPEGVTEFEDLVHQKTLFNNSEIDDFVILRSDGSPVYQIAVVVDDHDMEISHVIRGDDHLSNTPKQILLYRALGWEVPVFAHLPMILDEQKKKLSKRRNTVSVEDYKDKGYLPEALFNFLTLLGFAPEQNREILSRTELIESFTFNRVNKASSVFDMNKLNWINSEYIKDTDENAIAELVLEKLESISVKTQDAEKPRNLSPNHSIGYTADVIKLMKERVSTINDFIEFGSYFFYEPETYDEKALVKHWNNNSGIKPIFKKYAENVPDLQEWSPDKLEENLRFFTDSEGIKAGDLIHVLRLALTGISISPGIFELMTVLGRKEVISRLDRFMTKS